MEASFQDELDPGNTQHEEHARNLVVTLMQQLEAKALESGDFLTKNKLEEIISTLKVRHKEVYIRQCFTTYLKKDTLILHFFILSLRACVSKFDWHDLSPIFLATMLLQVF